MKYLINLLFNLNKVTFTERDMMYFDDFLFDKLSANKELIGKDIFSLLHLVIMMLKTTYDPKIRYALKKSISILLDVLSNVDTEQYKSIGTDKDKKDEFERLIQFVALVSTEMSLNPELFKTHYQSIHKIVQMTKSLDLNKLNSKTLAFLISLFGKTSLYDDVVTSLRDRIYKQFQGGKANIFDIVETFNTLMMLNQLKIEDL